MPKKDAKAKKATKKLRTAQKAEKIATKKSQKSSSKSHADDASDAESDVDLDAVLASYAQQQAAFAKITETPSPPPSARSSATLLASPSNSHELLLFGGEYYDGALARFYNDLFIYHVARDEWRIVTSPNSPLPRSGHAWCRGGNAGGVWLFGGEFSSPKQGTFYHYGDFWRLDPGTREWGKVEVKGKGPPARSGHRMTYFKNYIILFGGFQDTSQTTKYLADLWLYDTANFTWHSPALPPASQKPEARSSFSFLPHDSGAVLYGGYSRVKVSSTSSRPNKGSGGAAFQATALKPLVHQDTWFLRITPPPPEASASAAPTVRWERRKRPANPPNPARAGATMAYHRGRGIQFGGVHDVEKSEEGIDSEFFNTLFVWNIDRNRYFSLALRRPKAGQKKQIQATDRSRRGRGKADEEELLANLAVLEMKGAVTAEEVETRLVRAEEQEAVEEKPEKPVTWEMPHPRFNAQLTVLDDVLYVYGGTFEKGDREYTFNELWAIDLGKLDGVKEIFRHEVQDWQGSEDEESGGDDEDEDDGDEDSEGEELEADTQASPVSLEPKSAQSAAGRIPGGQKSSTEALVSIADSSEIDLESYAVDPIIADDRPSPRPFESLRDFYARTSQRWQEMILQDRKSDSVQESKSVKEVRKGAFERAEEKWWDCREEIRVLEDEQEEAGIGEVVSLAERGAMDGTGVAGRRR